MSEAADQVVRRSPFATARHGSGPECRLYARVGTNLPER